MILTAIKPEHPEVHAVIQGHVLEHLLAPELHHLGIYLRGVAGRGRYARLYVRKRECNHVSERCMRALKEECLYLHRSSSLQGLAEAWQIIGEFIVRYDTSGSSSGSGIRPLPLPRAALLAE